MPGPLPKDASIRARRNTTSTKTQLVDHPKRKVPPIGKRTDVDPETGAVTSRAWHPNTVDWWKDLWKSPMAGEFLPSDKHSLLRLAVLVDDYWRAPSKDLASEIRLQEANFGMTPGDRRRLQWTRPTPADDDKDGSTPTGGRSPRKGGVRQGRKKDDPRLTLVS